MLGDWAWRSTVVAGLAVLACNLYAVDGLVLINQASALAGNVTPGDTPGFPVTISTPGSYRLTGNLVITDLSANVIEITSDNVTIDLNGFSLIGPVVCTGSPVSSCPFMGSGTGIFSSKSNLTVLNGTIRGMNDGITFVGGDNHIEKVHATSNTSIGIGSGNGQSLVTSCDTSFNGVFGIFGNGKAEGNVAEGNGLDGIVFAGAMTNNVAANNKGNGISGQGVFSGNSATTNGQAGINAICPSFVSGNYAFQNKGGNIFTTLSGCIPANNANNAAP